MDGATFCQKCGAKVLDSQPTSAPGSQVNAPAPSTVDLPKPVQPVSQPTQPVQPAQPQQQAPSVQQAPGSWQPTPSPTPQKKKIPKWPFFVGGGAVVVVLALILVVIFGDIGKPKYDYEATLRAYTPYADSQGLPYTFGEVMDKYLEDAAWDVDEKEDGQAVVTVSGTLKGFGEEAVVTYSLTPNPEDSGKFKFMNEGVTVNSEKSSWDGASGWFLTALYDAYESGDEELADLTGLLVAPGIHEPELTETYTNEDAGISFKYPKAWQEPSGGDAEQLSSLGETFGDEVFSAMDSERYLNQFNSFIGVYKSIEPVTQDDVDFVLGDDDEFIDSIGFDPAVTETSVIKIGTVPARKVSSDAAEDVRVRIYMYAVGSDEYTVLFVRGGKETKQLEHCFDAIMDTYTITVPEPTPTPAPTPSPTPAPTPTPEPTPVPKTPLNDITFRGESLVAWGNGPAEIAYDRFGMPDDAYTDVYSMDTPGEVVTVVKGTSVYNEGVYFYYDPQTMINTNVIVFTPSAVQFNGSPMSDTRDGIISSLGTPDDDRTWNDGTLLTYYYDEACLEIEVSSSGAVLQINIIPY